MALTSTSTLAEVKAAYRDNLDYDTSASLSKCVAFIQAARFWITYIVDEVASGDQRVRDNYQKLQDELKKAEQWRAANDSTAQTAGHAGSVRHASIEDFRT